VASGATIGFGLASALGWGAGDFFGGIAAKRGPAILVVLFSQVLGLTVTLTVAMLSAEPFPPLGNLAWDVAAGASGVIGLLLLYKGLASGHMGVVAPITGVTAAAVPTIVGLILAGLPGPLVLAGFVLALVGIVMVSRPEGTFRLREVSLAATSGFLLGGFLVLVGLDGIDALWWPLAATRVANVGFMTVLALAVRPSAATFGQWWRPALAAGALDIVGNGFFILASQAGRLDLAAILSSLYPASTMVLAAFVLKERLARVQWLGAALILVAIPLMARG